MRDDIIDLFEKRIFRIKIMHLKRKKKNRRRIRRKQIRKKKDDYKNFIKYIEDESKGIDYELFEDYFNFVAPTVLTETLCEIKNKKENDKLVNVIKSGLIDLKDEIEKMSEDEKKTKKPDKTC